MMHIILTQAQRDYFLSEKVKVKKEDLYSDFQPVPLTNGLYALPIAIFSDKTFEKLKKHFEKESPNLFSVIRALDESEIPREQ